MAQHEKSLAFLTKDGASCAKIQIFSRLQRYEKIMNPPNFSKDIFGFAMLKVVGSHRFLKENLAVCEEVCIFAP